MTTLLYTAESPSREDLEAQQGLTLLEFGVDWCGHCHAALAPVTEALAACPGVRHLRVEDGAGRPLGRSFGVKLWPTLVLLVDGQERGRLVRPTTTAAVAEALRQVSTPAPQPGSSGAAAARGGVEG